MENGSEMPVATADHTGAVDRQFRALTRNTIVAIASGLGLAGAIAFTLDRAAGGAAPDPRSVLYPAFPMFFLVVLVLAFMAWKRIGGVLRGRVPLGFYRTFDGGEEPDSIRVVTRNFINLFEVPVLFYVGLFLALLAGQVSHAFIGLAWAYVVLRYAHSFVHVTTNDVPLRFSLYASSGIVLLVSWATVLAGMLTS